ncbi:MAG: PaaI family thioesterase [Desulfobacteraceae bacterium]|nr:PaaI family thioesterase [Desulfobacteraceae bacterium]
MNDLLEYGKQVLASQPFSLHVGAELEEFRQGKAVLKIPVTQNLKQQHGFVHGGVISYAVDNALTFAGGSALGPGVVTSEYKINYIRPATGSHIISSAEIIHTGKNQAVCKCEVFSVNQGNQALCAVAQGTISKIGKDSKNTA